MKQCHRGYKLALPPERLIFCQNISDPCIFSKCKAILSTSAEGRNELGEFRGYWRKAGVCRTTELTKILLRTSSACIWLKACYLSTVVTTLLCYFPFSGNRLKDIVMYLGCGPMKESKGFICSSHFFSKTIDRSLPPALKSNNYDRYILGWLFYTFKLIHRSYRTMCPWDFMVILQVKVLVKEILDSVN